MRIDTDLRRDLDRIEASVHGAGYRDFSRSDLIRAALASFGVRETIPEISTIVLPEEREGS